MITDIVIAAAAVLFLGVYVSWRAGRLDRMHTRLEAACAALDATLVRRSSVALELASSGFLDPATSLLLASAAHEARGGLRAGAGEPPGEAARSELVPGQVAPGDLLPAHQAPRELSPADLVSGDDLDRSELTQSNLSRALRAAFAQPGFRASLDGKDGAGELIAEVESAAQQVFVARTFYNNAVGVTRAARRKPLVRLLRLAGNARRPAFFEMDDSLIAESADGLGADMQRLPG